VNGSPTPALQWQFRTDGSTWLNINGATSPNYVFSAVPFSANRTRYRVVASNSAGSLASAGALLTVGPSAPVVKQQPQNVNVASPAAATFAVVASGDPAPSYQWQQSNDGGATWFNVAGATATTYTLPNTDAARDAGLRFRVVVTNQAGSVTSTVASLDAQAGQLCSGANGTGWCWAHPSPQGNFLKGVASPTTAEQVVVGDAGTILRTSDTGANWAPVASGTTQNLESIAFSDLRTGVAVGAGGTLLRTTDVGRSWAPVASGTTQNLFRVAFSGSVGLAVGANGTVLRSSDTGATWQPVASNTTSDLHGVAFASSAVAIAVGADGVFRSADSGLSWMRLPGTALDLQGVAFSDGSHGVAVGDRGIARTIDGGQTWNASVSGGLPSALRSVAFFDANHGYAVGAGDVWGTSDGGASWGVMVDRSISSSGLGDIVYSSGAKGVLVGGAGKIYEITGGGNFTLVGTRLSTGALNAVAYADTHTVVAVGPSKTILRSTDGGQTWSGVANPSDAPLYSLALFDGTLGLAAGKGGILRTTDAGVTWASRRSFSDVAALGLAVAPGGNTALVVGEHGFIMRSDDKGLTWQDVVPATSYYASRLLMGVAFATDSTAIAVGMHTGSATQDLIVRSTDGGQTWKDIASGIPFPLYAVAFGSSTTGVAVGGVGTVLRTTDGGATWAHVSSGTSATLDRVTFLSPTTAYAVGASGTVLRSVDGGLTWSKQNSGTTAFLQSLAGANATSLVVVGGDAAILTTKNGGQ
jgi:photosystem II stability/assembly factor-like uncharacterized protein